VLARAFAYPPAADDGQLGAAAAAVRAESARHLPSEVDEALGGLADAVAGVADRRPDYVRTFGHVTVAECPLHETACEEGDPFRQPQTLADLAGFYRAWGLELAAGAGERADHLAIELEFMHYLAFREAWALEHHGSERAALVQASERRFLAEHLGRWGPAVARAAGSSADGWVGEAARLLERFLVAEMAAAGITAESLGPTPRALPGALDDPDAEDTP
jgi:TorA maturation chaperone TorD